jgi:hypothetical protein
MSEADLYYRIGYSGKARDSVKEIARRAARAGRLAEARRALLQMEAWLRADPESLGEPIQDYIEAQQTEYVGVVSFLLVRYSIHFPTRQVFVSRPIEIVRWAGY